MNLATYPLRTESDHTLCDSSTEAGCTRCLITQSQICCDIHTPDFFTAYSILIPKPQRLPPCSRVPKFEMTSRDLALVNALEDWRENMTAHLYSAAYLHELGPGRVMSSATLDRIVTCAHAHKIKTVADLQRETHWSGAEKHGSDIIELVQKHVPLPLSILSPFSSAPLQSTITVATVVTDARDMLSAPAELTKRKIRCSACGEEGHNGRLPMFKCCLSIPSKVFIAARNRGCKMNQHYGTGTSADKENVV